MCIIRRQLHEYKIMNRLKGIIYNIIGRLAILGTRKNAAIKKVLIVRVDEIGDFMLWHNCLREMITAKPYKAYQIHFCGNQSWKSLFEYFDSDAVNQSFWLNKTRFKTDMGYRYRFLKQIYCQGYDVVINPTFSRDKRYDDSIVKAAKAPETIGMVANLESVRTYEYGYDRKLYTRLFNHPEKPIFEFYRNRFFTEFVTGQPSLVMSPKTDSTRLPVLNMELPDNYFVVFPGSRSKTRIWPTENFILVSKYLFENKGWTAVVCGTSSDSEYTSAFCEQYPYPVLNLTGKTSLIDMLSVFKKAACLLSVDTGSVHLAAAVGCTVFGIFNGSQYKRFAPYPAEMATNFYAVYPDKLEAELQDENIVAQKYEFVVPVPYASVKAEQVIHTIYRHYPVK